MSITVLSSSTVALAIIQIAELKAAVSAVAGVVNAKDRVPILQDIALGASADGKLIVAACDLDMHVEIAVPAEGIHPRFAVTANAKMLRDVLRTIKSGTVSLQASILPPDADHSDRLPAALTIRTGGMEVSVPGHGPAAYPTVEIASEVEPHSFRMAGHVLWSALEATRDAISTEETRYYLNGLYMHQPVRADDSNEIAFVATDGHRLNRQFFDLPEGAAGMPGVIIPRKAVDILHKLAGGEHPDLVEIDVTAQRGCFTFGNVSITTKMVDGTFPDYERVVPVGNNMEIRVSSPELLQTIDGLAAVLPRGAGRIQIDADEEGCTLSVRNADGGEGGAAAPNHPRRREREHRLQSYLPAVRNSERLPGRRTHQPVVGGLYVAGSSPWRLSSLSVRPNASSVVSPGLLNSSGSACRNVTAGAFGDHQYPSRLHTPLRSSSFTRILNGSLARSSRRSNTATSCRK